MTARNSAGGSHEIVGFRFNACLLHNAFLAELSEFDVLGLRRYVLFRHDHGNVFRYEAAINDASGDHRTYDVLLGFRPLITQK